MGTNAVGVANDRVLSPTRAIINGRETILAGTNNYMGITFDEKCIEAGAWDYLSKPVDTEQLLTVLRAWLRR